MSDNSQAAHEAAYRKAVDASRGAGTFCEERRTFGAIYHEHMLAHLRPAIEAQAREAALREAAEQRYDKIAKKWRANSQTMVSGMMISSAEDSAKAIRALPLPTMEGGKLCEDCPPIGYPTDKTRCCDCPRKERT